MLRSFSSFAVLTTFTAGLLLSACDTTTVVGPLPGAPAELQAPSGPSHYACENLQSQEVCSATSTCVWSLGSGECIRQPLLPIKH